MKKTRKGVAATLSVLLAMFCATNAFAANPYNIEYAGGQILGTDNVQINSELVASMTPLLRTGENITVNAPESPRIETGYLHAGSSGTHCRPVKYVTVSNGNTVGPSDNITYTLTQDGNTISVTLKNIVLENVEDGRVYTVGIGDDTNILYTGYHIYEDSECQTAKSGINHLGRYSSERIFVDMSIKVYNTDNLSSPRLMNNLYFGLTDIDMAQSYKILNTNNTLQKSRMFALDPEDLQSRRGNPLRNMYVEDGNYIYSEYSFENSRMSTLNLPDTANVYTFIHHQAQSEGLNIVLGFATDAYNGIEYYVSGLGAEDTLVHYNSDELGTITGIESETVSINGNPSGSTTSPNTGYALSHWIADKDVELVDWTVINAGDPISNEDLKRVLITQEITFTAIHIIDDNPLVPNTGMNTENTYATRMSISIFGVTLGALFIKLLPRLHHKKVNFDK